MFLRRWVARGQTPWGAPRLVPNGEESRVVVLQGALIGWLMRFDESSASLGDEGAHASGDDIAAAAAASGLPRLLVAPSTIPAAGRGVFLAPGSSLQADDIITLYPGLVYDKDRHVLREMAASCPGDDDAFAPTPPPFAVNNRYLLHLRACLGRSLMVDGRPTGLSRQRYAAAMRGADGPINDSWLALEGPGAQDSVGNSSATTTDSTASHLSGSDKGASLTPHGNSSAERPHPLLQQAALGHLLNHQPPPHANAVFDLCPLPDSLPAELLRFVPALNASGADPGLRWVPLLRALRPLAATHASGPVELFTDYGTDPTTLGFH